jgi:hypothetical protein
MNFKSSKVVAGKPPKNLSERENKRRDVNFLRETLHGGVKKLKTTVSIGDIKK